MTTDNDRNGQRHYRCANRPCGRQEAALAIPKGWMGLMQYPGDFELRPAKLGVFCSLDCLIEAAKGMRDRAAEVVA